MSVTDSINENWIEENYWWELPFLKLWVKAVGTKGYDKKEWQNMRNVLEKLSKCHVQLGSDR